MERAGPDQPSRPVHASTGVDAWLRVGPGLLLLVGAGLCGAILLPFVPALVWSLALAVLSARLEEMLRTRLHRPWLSTGLTLLFVAVAIVIPAFLVAQALVDELVRNSQRFGELLMQDHWSGILHRYPWLVRLLDKAGLEMNGAAVLRPLSDHVATWSGVLVHGSVSSVVELLLTFYFLFYLLRDRRTILAAVAGVLPLARDEFDLLAGRMAGTVRASLYGTVAVAALQGVLGGLMFWFLDLPSPAFWGVVMGLLAVVPFLGAFVIWAPAALGLALAGQYGAAMMLALWGLIVVGLIDNLVYPVLVGRQIAMHSLVSFIAIVGGVFVFGAQGLVLGPLCVTATATLHGIWRKRRAG